MRQALFALAMFSAMLSASAIANPITVHNTGVDASDSLVDAGAQTAFWTLSAVPPDATQVVGSAPFRYHNDAYFADTPTAAWVAPQADGTAGALGFYTYDLVIDLTGLNPATASISGTFGSDNDAAISVNAAAAAATTGSDGFTTPTPFTLASGFVAGLNTIHVTVDNAGDPTAFFVSFTSATASPDYQTLFTNWSGSIVGGGLYTAGGNCSFASCFGIGDNFSVGAQDAWIVNQITVYVVSFSQVVAGGGWRYALFTAAGDPVVAPTDTAITFTDLGNYFDTYELYKGVISGVNIPLGPGEYQFRFTNTQTQGVYPAYGSSTSAQTISPGFFQLTGSASVESLLSTDVTQRSEEWAFELAGAKVGVLQVSPATLDFGAVVENTPSDVRFVTLTNLAGTDITVNSVTTASAPFEQNTDGTCSDSLPFVIPAGGQCTLSYLFTPTAQEVASQSFTIASDGVGDTGFTLQGSGDLVFKNGFDGHTH